jgi:hypothetical protein
METKSQIQLLKLVDSTLPHQTITVQKDESKWAILHKWLASGIINGHSGSSEEGDVFWGVSLTPEGKALLSTLEDSTSLGFIRKHRFAFYKWFFWIIGVVLAAWLVKQIIG